MANGDNQTIQLVCVTGFGFARRQKTSRRKTQDTRREKRKAGALFAIGDASTAQGCPTIGRATLGILTWNPNRNAVPSGGAWHCRARPEPRCGWKTDADRFSFASTQGRYPKASYGHLVIGFVGANAPRSQSRRMPHDIAIGAAFLWFPTWAGPSARTAGIEPQTGHRHKHMSASRVYGDPFARTGFAVTEIVSRFRSAA